MPLEFENKISGLVRGLPIVRKTEERCEEGVECDWKDALLPEAKMSSYSEVRSSRS
jgi:hypothetical protein